MSEWKTIDSAPKDGRVVLVGRHAEGFGFVRGYGRFEGVPGAFVSGWISNGFDPVIGALGLAHPTHWMPLPRPPGSMNDIQRLRAFAQSTIDAAMGLPHLDSTDVLEDAKRLGLLAPNIMDRPCRRDCPCEPLDVGVACYRKTAVLTGEVATLSDQAFAPHAESASVLGLTGGSQP